MLRPRLRSSYCIPKDKLKDACIFAILCFSLSCTEVMSCGPGRGAYRRRAARKLTPLVFKQHIPNIAEHSLGASGPPEGKITRDDARFKNLVPNYNMDIVFKDEEGTAADRLMTKRCKEKLDTLAISVMNQWPGIRLRVTEGYDEEGHHSRNSLHYEGRAVDITTSDRDPSKYGMLARLAVDAGFDWVFYEARSHIHCSVKIESTVPSKSTGCFHGSSKVMTRKGAKLMQELHIGDEVLTFFAQTKSLGYSNIIAFLHRDPHAITTFIKMKTEFNSSLLITANHIVFHSAMDQEFQPCHASHLRAGDSIYSFHSYELTKVVIHSIDYQLMRGVFAPLTEEGTIIVNGIWTSCYAVVDSHLLAHLILLPLRLVYKLETKWLTHPFIFQILNKAAPWVTKPLITAFGFDETEELNKVHWFPRTLCRLTTTMHIFYCLDDVD